MVLFPFSLGSNTAFNGASGAPIAGSTLRSDRQRHRAHRGDYYFPGWCPPCGMQSILHWGIFDVGYCQEFQTGFTRLTRLI